MWKAAAWIAVQEALEEGAISQACLLGFWGLEGGEEEEVEVLSAAAGICGPPLQWLEPGQVPHDFLTRWRRDPDSRISEYKVKNLSDISFSGSTPGCIL